MFVTAESAGSVFLRAWNDHDRTTLKLTMRDLAGTVRTGLLDPVPPAPDALAVAEANGVVVLDLGASTVSDDHWRAVTAVGAEESLERKYRLEPGEGVRARFDQSAAALTAALAEVQRDGDASDRALVDQVTVRGRALLLTTGRLFDAIDRGETAAALRMDAEETDPAFGVMEAAVLGAAAESHNRALVALQELQDLELITRVFIRHDIIGPLPSGRSPAPAPGARA